MMAGATFETDKVIAGNRGYCGAGGMAKLLKSVERRFDSWRPDHDLRPRLTAIPLAPMLV